MPRKKTLKRRKPIAWKEPNRRGRAPTVSTKGAAEMLKRSIESVHQLVALGPEYDGLPAYIQSEDGIGFIRKAGNHSTHVTMFYREDIEAWDNAHPYFPEPERVAYTDYERAFVLSEAEKIKEPDGSVYRQKLRAHLASVKPGQGWGTTSKYGKVRQILLDAHIPLPARTPQTTQRRKYRVS